MKQAFLNFPGKKFVSAAFLSAALLLTSQRSDAAIHASNIEILADDKSSIQFIGNTADALIFKVHVNNEKSEDFTLMIKNENGDILFSKSFSDSNFQKQFKVLTDDDESKKYYFTITSKNRDIDETYVITALTHTVSDVVINKL